MFSFQRGYDRAHNSEIEVSPHEDDTLSESSRYSDVSFPHLMRVASTAEDSIGGVQYVRKGLECLLVVFLVFIALSLSSSIFLLLFLAATCFFCIFIFVALKYQVRTRRRPRRPLTRLQVVQMMQIHHIVHTNVRNLGLILSDRDFNENGMEPRFHSHIDYETLIQLDRDLPSRGLDQSLINRLPKFPFTNSSASSQCSICLEEFVSGDQLRALTCLHRFHVVCIDHWLGKKPQCPVCNHVVEF